MDDDIWLVVGLGNPGPGYAGNRHNVGQMALAQLADRASLTFKNHKANAAVAEETVARGLDKLEAAQLELGEAVRARLADRGFASVAAPEYAAASVVVVHTDDPALQSGAAFRQVGVQVAAGVPLKCGEPDSWSTFRLGLFGLDKLDDVSGTIERLEHALDRATTGG